MVKPLLDCPFPDCNRVGARGFNPARPDNLLHHRRLVHGEDIPKVRVRFGTGRSNVRGPVAEMDAGQQ